MTEFKLPELGENIEQGDLVRLMISPGASVTEGQPVMELETDKAVVEVPSSVSGTYKRSASKKATNSKSAKSSSRLKTVRAGEGRPQPRPPADTRNQPSRRAPPVAQTPPAAKAPPAAAPAPSAPAQAAAQPLRRPPRPPNSSCPNSARTSIRAIWSD